MHSTDELLRAMVLDAAAAAAAARTVFDLAAYWTPRDDAAFHTLGAALYLDAPRDETLATFAIAPPQPAQYEQRMARTNPLLRAHFDALYTALAAALETLLAAPVRYAEGRALPGFHVYREHPRYARQANHVPHFDRQYDCIAWPQAESIDFRRGLSFTLPLQLPVAGGGLRLWQVDLFDVLEAGRERARDIVAAAPRRLHRYRVGELVCHGGHALHQIAAWDSRPGDVRLTLQGHGLFYDGAWQLYW